MKIVVNTDKGDVVIHRARAGLHRSIRRSMQTVKSSGSIVYGARAYGRSGECVVHVAGMDGPLYQEHGKQSICYGFADQRRVYLWGWRQGQKYPWNYQQRRELSRRTEQREFD